MAEINIKLKLNDRLYLKDPQSTDLGKRILKHSVELIDEIGFEEFNFRKLAQQIKSTEASIYRYFENKHLLLIYLLNWYWEWMQFRIDFNTMNIDDPIRKLKIAISKIVDTAKRNTSVEFINEDMLHRIIVSEGTKGYHSKSVDKENEYGFFLSYKTLCLKIAGIIQEINPDLPYPRALASTLVETANNTIYFSQHLPRLTDIEYDSPKFYENIIQMLEHLAFGAINQVESTTPKIPSRLTNGLETNRN
jgi:AcrR family transcriptional regulator